jgi:hypothetical protein
MDSNQNGFPVWQGGAVLLRNFRNLQNTNSAAAEIAIRFGPKILLNVIGGKQALNSN